MNKTTKEAIEKSINYVEQKKVEYQQKLNGIKRLLATCDVGVERETELKQEYDEWQLLYNEAEATSLFLKIHLAFAED